MVNTFITYRKKLSDNFFIPDYQKSAKSLDRRRLLKQCVEAHQIINILDQLHKIAELEGWEDSLPVEKNEHDFSPEIQASRYISRIEWVKNTRKKYLSLEYRYARIIGNIKKIPKKSLPYKLYKDSVWEERDSKNFTVWIKKQDVRKVENTYPDIIRLDESILPHGKKIKNRIPFVFQKNSIALPEDEIFSLGFSQHAVIKMWIGYEDSLRDYINNHISVYKKNITKSGEQCSICLPTYKIPKDVIHPWWITKYDGVILSHRASLLRKERERNEPEWYWKNKDFTNISKEWLELGYVWPGSFPSKKADCIISSIISGEKISPNEVAATINADKKPQKTQHYLRHKYNYTGSYLLDQDGYVQIVFIK